MAALCLSILFLFMITKVAISLKCYQTDIETGETNIIEDDDFIFCIVFPPITGSTQFSKSVSAGLKIEELDKPVEEFFGGNDNVYQLLSVCLFEKYEWPIVWNAKFKKGKRVEYSLRCICNIDLCNSSDFFTNHVNFLAQSE